MRQFTYLKRIEVPVNRLEIGMYVAELDKPWRSSSFLFQGFPIETEQQLEQLRNECEHVFVDFKSQQEYEVFLHRVSRQVETVRLQETEQDLALELPRARAAFQQTLAHVTSIKQQIAAQQPWTLAMLEVDVGEMASSLKRNPDALQLAAASRSRSHYPFTHSMRVAVLAMAFGQQLGMSPVQIRRLGLGAVLHDIGKMVLPDTLINKPGKLDRDEALMLANYPELSHRLLAGQFGVSDVVKDIVLSHHEREDGRGYPRHIGKDRVSRDAKIVGIIDAFDALISDRSYADSKPIEAAIKLLNDGKRSKYDPELIDEFVRWLGSYPVGSLVEMASGELALVLHNRGARKLMPRLLLISDEHGRIGYQKVIDLSRSASRPTGEPYRIRGLATPSVPTFELAPLLDQLSSDRARA